jgi:hypothetical protein
MSPHRQRVIRAFAILFAQLALGGGFVALGLMRDTRPLQLPRISGSLVVPFGTPTLTFSEREYGWPVSWWREVYVSVPTTTGQRANLIGVSWNPGVVAAAAFIAWGLPIVVARCRTRNAVRRVSSGRVVRLAVVATWAGFGSLMVAWFDCVAAQRVPHTEGPLSDAWDLPGLWNAETAAMDWRAGSGIDRTWVPYLWFTFAGLIAGAVVGFVLARPRRQSNSGPSAPDGAAATTPPSA